MANCNDCLHYEVCKPMGHAMRNAMKMGALTESVEHKCFIKCFKPTADVVEVKHGRWERDSHWQYDYVCSICSDYAPEGQYGNHDNLTDYCPNCGAKME